MIVVVDEFRDPNILRSRYGFDVERPWTGLIALQMFAMFDEIETMLETSKASRFVERGSTGVLCTDSKLKGLIIDLDSLRHRRKICRMKRCDTISTGRSYRILLAHKQHKRTQYVALTLEETYRGSLCIAGFLPLNSRLRSPR